MGSYRVIGPCEIAGARHGDAIEIDDDRQAEALIFAGHLEAIDPEPIEPDPKRAAAIKRAAKKRGDA